MEPTQLRTHRNNHVSIMHNNQSELFSTLATKYQHGIPESLINPDRPQVLKSSTQFEHTYIQSRSHPYPLMKAQPFQQTAPNNSDHYTADRTQLHALTFPLQKLWLKLYSIQPAKKSSNYLIQKSTLKTNSSPRKNNH